MNSCWPRALTSAPCILGPLPLSGVHALDHVYESNSRTKPIPIFHNLCSSCSTHLSDVMLQFSVRQRGIDRRRLRSWMFSLTNDLSPCQAAGTAPFGHHPGRVETIAPVTLRLLLLEWNAKSGCAVASIILASDGNAYIPGRIRPPLGTHDSQSCACG